MPAAGAGGVARQLMANLQTQRHVLFGGAPCSRATVVAALALMQVEVATMQAASGASADARDTLQVQ